MKTSANVLKRIVLILWVFLATAQAAQNARVIRRDAEVHQQPNEEATVIERLSPGVILRVSDKTREGWYRVYLPEQSEGIRFGWMKESDLTPDDLVRDLRAAGVQQYSAEVEEAGRHYWAMKLLYGFAWVSPKQLQGAAGQPTSSSSAPFYALQFGIRASTDWTISLLLGRHEYSGAGEASGTLLGLSFEYAFVHSLPWKVDLELGGGTAMGTEATTSSASAASQSVSLPLAFLKLNWDYYWSDQWAVALGLGYRFMGQDAVRVSGRPIYLNLSGPTADIGLKFDF